MWQVPLSCLELRFIKYIGTRACFPRLTIMVDIFSTACLCLISKGWKYERSHEEHLGIFSSSDSYSHMNFLKQYPKYLGPPGKCMVPFSHYICFLSEPLLQQSWLMQREPGIPTLISAGVVWLILPKETWNRYFLNADQWFKTPEVSRLVQKKRSNLHFW